MRGADRQSGKLFSYISPEAMVPPSHPLRVIRPLVNASTSRIECRLAYFPRYILALPPAAWAKLEEGLRDAGTRD